MNDCAPDGEKDWKRKAAQKGNSTDGDKYNETK